MVVVGSKLMTLVPPSALTGRLRPDARAHVPLARRITPSSVAVGGKGLAVLVVEIGDAPGLLGLPLVLGGRELLKRETGVGEEGHGAHLVFARADGHCRAGALPGRIAVIGGLGTGGFVRA